MEREIKVNGVLDRVVLVKGGIITRITLTIPTTDQSVKIPTGSVVNIRIREILQSKGSQKMKLKN